VQSQISQQETAAMQAQQQAAMSYQQQPPPAMQAPIPQMRPAQPVPPQPTGPASGAQVEAVRLLDNIAARARSGIPGNQLAQEMEQTRNRIVEVFQWHPALFELAATACRLKQVPTALDAGTLNNLLGKLEEWKRRILA